MVISSSSTHGTDSTQSPPAASVSKPHLTARLDTAPTNNTSVYSNDSTRGLTEKQDGKVEDVCKHAHCLDVNHVANGLHVELSHGLSTSEVTVRLERDGPNKLEDSERISSWQIFLRQISNSLTMVLAITLILSFSLHDYIEGAVISAVVLLNIIVGFVQDYRAEKTILSLQALSAPTCKVLRDSQVQVVKADSLVVGDVVQLVVGDVVPGDLRLFDSMNLTTDEALLTGESLPIAKTPDSVLSASDIPIGDRINMAYSASIVAQGRGSGIVVATGMNTEVGKIAALLQVKNDTTKDGNIFARFYKRTLYGAKHALGLVGSPLQVKLSKFALLLFGMAILLAIIVFSASKWDVRDEVLIYGICVAVAVIPESLIAVLTLTMAVGTKAMAKCNIVVRKMASLEAVGGVTNICSDKTGTLTQGKMIARKAIIPGAGSFTVHNTTNPFDPTSGQVKEHYTSDIKSSSALTLFLDIVALCNLSSVKNFVKDEAEDMSVVTVGPSNWVAVGEPTEIALQVLAMRFNHGKVDILSDGSRKLLSEHPFDSGIKRMSMAYSRSDGSSIDVFTKGATEVLLPILNCSDEEKAQITRDAEGMAGEGLRVLCLAHKSLKKEEQDLLADRATTEANMNFAGLIGLYDPPRVETAGAVRKCQQAGIMVHMLTGDHICTATAIAIDVGIVTSDMLKAPSRPGHAVTMVAADFDKMSDSEIDALDNLPVVVARCSPSTKVRMVQALHRRKAFCVMTGDGVNDSPALKIADVGIAMGQNGSDVAKQAADMVLADDNFASIVSAVEEGRRLFDNIQKFLLHLLTSNIAQVVLLIIGLAFEDDNGSSVFPLSPIEILWANLVTSSPLALGLGLEPASVDVMSRAPRSLRVGIFTKELILDKMVYGVTMGSLCLVGFVAVVYGGGNGRLGQDCNQNWNETCDVVFNARATVFAILTFTLLATAWEVKDLNRSLFAMGSVTSQKKSTRAFSVFPTVYQNRFLFWSCVAGFVLVFPLIYIPTVNSAVFKHHGITWEWGVVFGCLAVYVAVIETWKASKRWSTRKNGQNGEVMGLSHVQSDVSSV